MKSFFILALLAMAATMATAQFDPNEQYQPYPEQQQPFQQQQQPFFWQHPLFHPLQQRLNQCKQFLMQRWSPVAFPFQGPQILQQSGLQLTRQQCCQQLAQIPEQLRCPAINSVIQSIVLQLQQQQLLQSQYQQGLYQPRLQQGIFQPQLQLGLYQPQLQQGFFQPSERAQLEGMRAFAHLAFEAMCNVYVPPHCSVATSPLGGF